MKLTILGKWSPYPPAGGACPGYLVEADGVRILLDCGSGVVSSLHRVGTAFDLNAIVISHLHPDHFTDIYPLRNELAYGRLPEDLTIQDWASRTTSSSPTTGAPSRC